MDPRELHIDRALTTYSIGYQQGAFVAEKVLPHIGVQKLSDKIKVYGTSHLKRMNTLLHDKAEPGLFEWGFGTDESYNLQGYGLRDYVSQSDIDNADKPIDAMKDTVAAMLDTLLLEKEVRAKTLICTAGSYGSSNKKTLSGTARWDDYSAGLSDPIGDISTAKKAVYASCGRPANSVIFDWKVGEVLSKHPDIIDLVKYTDKTTLKAGGLPPSILGLNVLEAGSFYDSAKRGQTTSFATIWGTFCVVAYVNPKPTTKSITLGITFQKGTRKVLKVWDPKVGVNGAYYVKVTLPEMDEKLISANCGYLFTTCIG